ncbi:MAG: protease inhibitor I42 family protein [Thermoplasmata archaeon]
MAEPRTEIRAQLGDLITIEVESNPTTGYDWVLDLPLDILHLESKRHTPSSDRIGAGGITSFRLHAISAGTAVVEGRYERAWEGTPAERRTWTIIVE